MVNIPKREWAVDLCPEFEAWLDALEDAALREEILAHAKALGTLGPGAGRPMIDTVEGSRYANMKELRMQHAGDPWRFLFAFDPRRHGIVLVGGNKAGQPDWYEVNIPIADTRYDAHLARLASRTTPKTGIAAPKKGRRT